MTLLRRATQALGVLLGYGYLSVLGSGRIYAGPFKGVCLPVLNCYACPLGVFSCPIGTLQHFMALRIVPLMLIGAIGLVGVLVGRMGCGWLCPFGLLQDLLYKIRSPKIRIPEAFANLKYLSLAVLVIAVPFWTGVPWFSRLCPIGTLTAGIPWALADPHDPETGRAVIESGDLGALFLVKLLVLGAFLALFVVSKRPFCRTACPLGAILSLFSRLSVVRLRVSDGCQGCGVCRERCPVDLQVSDSADSRECIRCLRCTSCKHVLVQVVTPGLRLAARSAENAGHRGRESARERVT